MSPFLLSPCPAWGLVPCWVPTPPAPCSEHHSTAGIWVFFSPVSCAVAVKSIPRWLMPLVGCIDFCSSLLVIFCPKSLFFYFSCTESGLFSLFLKVPTSPRAELRPGAAPDECHCENQHRYRQCCCVHSWGAHPPHSCHPHKVF